MTNAKIKNDKARAPKEALGGVSRSEVSSKEGRSIAWLRVANIQLSLGDKRVLKQFELMEWLGPLEFPDESLRNLPT